MDIFKMLRADIAESEREGLQRSLLADNIRKGRALAWVIIVFEACFAVADVSASIMKANSEFHFSLYLAMYLAMILVNLGFLMVTRRADGLSNMTASQITRYGRLLVSYVSVMLCWGAVISLMDQKLYGQIIVFMVNMMTCSVIFCLTNRQIAIPYVASSVILLAGLPFFQRSGDVLVGHYVNLFFFIFIAWVSSRLVCVRYCSDYRSRMLLMNANAQLEREIDLNKTVNLLLADANKQLRKQSLVDELTGIPNRRCFRNYIDAMFSGPQQEGMTFSVVMMDVDNFKEFNDNYGHVEADKALAVVAGQIQSVVRHASDIAARWGGEEFIYAAFDVDPHVIAASAEKIRKGILALRIPHGRSPVCDFVTLSIGYCTMEIQGKGDISKCIDKADKAMYKAKASGKNRVEKYTQ